MGRTWYEVRVRECISPPTVVGGRWVSGKYVKKSRFYFTNGPKDAAKKYRGTGNIISVEKVAREKLLGIGEFFVLGDKLLKELSEGGGLLEKLEKSKEERRKRFNFKKNLRRG